MEDAADALKIAFAVFVFVIAITLLFALTSQAKSTADYVLYYNDETNFYEYFNGSDGLKDGERIVSVSEIISTLYRYYKESISITININGASETFDLATESYSSEQAIQNRIKEYINNTLLNYKDEIFVESFIEVPISGIYMTGEDGTQITLSSGGSKVYVTYTLKTP